jgi:hypothetical protein
MNENSNPHFQFTHTTNLSYYCLLSDSSGSTHHTLILSAVLNAKNTAMEAKPAGNRLQSVPVVDRKTTLTQRRTTASTTLIALTAVAVIWHRPKIAQRGSCSARLLG